MLLTSPPSSTIRLVKSASLSPLPHSITTVFASSFFSCHILLLYHPTTFLLDPILQTISKDLLPFISSTVNGHLSSTFKTARVIPMQKKPILDTSNICNYQLVLLLSFPSKILEHAVYNQLSPYRSQNNLQDLK